MAERIYLLFTIQTFAKMVGVTNRTVEGWIDKGIIPSVKLGKRRLINAHAIQKKLDEYEDSNAVKIDF